MTTQIPADERVQVVTQSMLDQDAMTIRVESDSNADVRVFSSQDQEGDGVPLRRDDEIAVQEEDDFGGLETADGLWMETETSATATVLVLKGVAIRRNVRRDVRSVVESVVETNAYVDGQAIDEDGSAYPYTVDPAWSIQEINLTDVGDVVAEITTVGGSTFDVPLESRIGSYDHWVVDSITFKDPNNTGHALKGAVAGGATA